MRKLILSLILGLTLAFTPTQLETVQNHQTRPTISEDQELIQEAIAARAFDKYQAFINACRYTPYTCIGVSVPTVVYETMSPGLLGYYDGGETIYVRKGLRGVLRKEVLMHETVHYLQVKVGGLEVPGYAEPICAAENEAFTVVDRWLIDMNKASLVVGPEWWKPYTHCWPWYDPEYPNRSDAENDIWNLNPYGW